MDDPKPLAEAAENSPRKSKSVYDIDWANPPKPRIIIDGHDCTQAIEERKMEQERLGLPSEDPYLRRRRDYFHQVYESHRRAVTTGQDLLDGLRAVREQVDELRAVREQVDELRRLVRKLMRRHRRPMCQRNRRTQR